MSSYDTIIIGGGHNGLICAAYLARAGQKVLLLEANEALGGLASIRDFHPGFKASVAHSLQHFSAKIANDLQLENYGYSGGKPIPTLALSDTGQHVRILGDTVTGVSNKDASRYKAYRAQLLKFAKALAPSWMKTMPRVGNNSLKELLTFAQVGLKLKLLGRQDMREFLRIAALPSRDLMDENFDSDPLKAALSWDGLVGSTQAPRSPNNTVLMMLYRMTGEHGGDHSLPAGGIRSLVSALAASAEQSGTEIRTGSVVQRINIEAGENRLNATGVTLADGSTLSASRVVSAADPKTTFLNLVGAANLEIEFTNRIHRLRSKGYVAKLHLALSGKPAFTGVEDDHCRMIIAPEMDAIEFAWDDAKYGQCPQQPVMEVQVPSLADASLAPEGQHVLSANVMYIPYELKGDWTEAARSQLLEQLLQGLCRYAPGLREQILHAELLTPADLERDWRVSGGHWHHGEFAMDQMLMMRPTYEAAQHSTPIPGLYLCSAGCHPGGDICGAAGHNAAREILA